MSDKNDLLRRQDCINAIEEITSSMSVCVNADERHGMKRMQRQAVLEIANMPAAQPERKRGEWIYNSPITMKCDQCGFAIKDWDWHRFKFCPNCGADMRGGDSNEQA